MATTPTAPLHPARKRRPKSRGQSLAEFALTLPMALLMVLFGLDFGRLFLGWVALSQAAREAANYAAMNPTAWTVPYDLAAQAEYSRLITTEASSINCELVTPIAAPTFSSGTSIAAPAKVTLTCRFALITPIISNILGNSIPVSASAAFPIRAGYIEGIPVETTVPSATTGPTATAAPTDSAAPTATVTPSETPTPTPTPNPGSKMCTVVSLLNDFTTKTAAKWADAGFTGAVIFSPLVPPKYKVQWQSLTVGTSQLCTSGVTVRSSAP